MSVRPDSFPNSNPGDANYIYGSAKNISAGGLFDGYPFDAGWLNDYIGFFTRLLTEAGVTPSGTTDTALVSDLWDALEILLDLIDEKYLPNNVEKLLLNDASASPGDAYLGRGYQSSQFYAYQAAGNIYFGREAQNVQHYGQLATDGQYYGQNATGDIEIGSTAGSAPTKKMISGAKEATFEEIIDGSKQATTTAIGSVELATNTEAIAGTDTQKAIVPSSLKAVVGDGDWQTPTLSNSWAFSNPPLRYKLIENGQRLRIVGSINGSSATNRLAFTLPAAYRPSTYSGLNYFPIIASSQTAVYCVAVDDDGSIEIVQQSDLVTYPTVSVYINITVDMNMP